MTPLHLAVESGVPSLVVIVCNKYTLVNRFSIKGLTALQLAVKSRSPEIVEALLKETVSDLNKPLEESSTNLLGFAVKNGDRNIIRLLVKAGALLRVIIQYHST
ncbi:ankyrin repeat domain-containing protein [Shewanella sp. 202IG2-18]|nr:ankyrin repeat domain-containing protein [Parashewanella hymeniacidonis]MBM7073695.1 ankyrin repeat domain-containing protein [Parashewanella hymeniacidonis]